MRNYIGAKRIPDFSAANVAGVWSLDDISFFRNYGYIQDSSRWTVVENFTSSSTWRCPDGVDTVEYLVLAGGGGGYLSGGGAGGLRLGTGYPVTTNTIYTVTVGGGGTGTPGPSSGSNGSISFFGVSPATPGGIRADGGGGGGWLPGGGSPGNNGGCGGGPNGLGNLPNAYTPTQGYNGSPQGGGGTGSAGYSAPSPLGGGSNTISSITGTAVGYGAGGGNATPSVAYPGGDANAPAGRNSGPAGPPNATANFGGGGGGGFPGVGSGANGGSGRVILRYSLAKQNVVAFANSTTFTVPTGVTRCDYFVVAGGGGGAWLGGGGGGGGVRFGSNYPLVAGNTMPIVIGAGGSGGYPANPSDTGTGTAGTLSSFGLITASGGGFGGTPGQPGGGPNQNFAGQGGAGGSGGGRTGSTSQASVGVGNSPAFYPSQGNNGGDCISGTPHGGGGGGGAGAAGTSVTPTAPTALGNGGIGILCPFIPNISPLSTIYFGGGGGGHTALPTRAVGGLSGGADSGTGPAPSTPGGVMTGNSAIQNLGGGGGGGNPAGRGSSGMVIIKYYN